jgi:GNAT superfamily N-acetyltransferase
MITIDLLKNHKNAVPQLAKMWHELLGKAWMPDVSIDYIEGLIGSWINDNTLPLAYVALKNNEIIGLGSLQNNCGIRFDLGPWLGSLIVDRCYQKQGIGELLVTTIQEKAKQLGFNDLYLFTFDKALLRYYHRLGWTEIGIDDFCDKPVTIMKISLYCANNATN